MFATVQTLAYIKALLAQAGLSPRHALGQNFLIDHNLLRKMVEAADLRPGTRVLEVGPGTGTLTEELLARGAVVTACELDGGLAQLLRRRLGTNERFTLVEGDCLAGKHDLHPGIVHALAGSDFRLVANLPYGCATPLMLHLLTRTPRCDLLAVTVQKEVADRVLARPGSKDYGPLAVAVALTCEAQRLANLPPACFWPQPKVTSSMIVLRRLPTPGHTDCAGVVDFCQRLFQSRRKQLGGVLQSLMPGWRKERLPADISPTSRAEDLPPLSLARLYEAVTNIGTPRS